MGRAERRGRIDRHWFKDPHPHPRTTHLKPGTDPQDDVEVDTRLQSSLQEKDGGKAKSDALVRGGTQAWTQRVPHQ